MKMAVAAVLFGFCFFSANVEAGECLDVCTKYIGTDDLFDERFVPDSEETARYRDMMQWRVSHCIEDGYGQKLVVFGLVGNSDPQMEEYEPNPEGNASILVEGRGWIPTTDFNIEEICSLQNS